MRFWCVAFGSALFVFGGVMQYTKEELNKFNLYSLRELGREIGVKAPSTLKKEQLIEQILGVLSGKIEPTFSTRGRPKLKMNLSTREVTLLKEYLDKIFESAKNDIIKAITN